MNRFQAVLELMGHKMVVRQRETKGQRWVLACSCGYESTGRATQAEAARTGIWHAKKVRDELLRQQAMGVSLPENVREAL